MREPFQFVSISQTLTNGVMQFLRRKISYSLTIHKLFCFQFHFRQNGHITYIKFAYVIVGSVIVIIKI